MANPKITYISGGATQTLNFARQPRKVPAYYSHAVRHDNVAASGVREAVLERVESFLEFEMEYVAIGSDVQAWNSFLQYALQGGLFSYYPDSSQSAFINYWLEDTTWRADYKFVGQYTFKVKFRQVVT